MTFLKIKESNSLSNSADKQLEFLNQSCKKIEFLMNSLLSGLPKNFISTLYYEMPPKLQKQVMKILNLLT